MAPWVARVAQDMGLCMQNEHFSSAVAVRLGVNTWSSAAVEDAVGVMSTFSALHLACLFRAQRGQQLPVSVPGAGDSRTWSKPQR